MKITSINQALKRIKAEECYSFDEIRRAYHKEIRENHPDKVAHLSKEIRELAAKNTLELNLAFECLKENQEYFAKPNMPSTKNGAGIATSKTPPNVGIEPDRQALAKLILLLGQSGAIEFVRTHDFSESFVWSRLDGFQQALYLNIPGQFIDPELEQLRLDFETAWIVFLDYVCSNTAVLGDPLGGHTLQGIYKDWWTEQPERVGRSVKEMHTLGGDVYSAYDKLVRTARKKLST